jgi:crotonobetainyl-CoA:carnitine CoA-transferase CaiB-like acyl-CoA transferase
MPQAANREVSAAPHGCYRCKGDERWCAITVYSDKEWQAFCRALGSPAWAKDSVFATIASRKENEDRLDALVEEWTLQHTAEEAANIMQRAGITAGVVSNGEDLNNNPQLAARGFYKMLEHTEIGPVPFSNPPFKLSKTPTEVSKAAPCFGEHTEHVCREILGMSDDEFIDLLNSGVLE